MISPAQALTRREVLSAGLGVAAASMTGAFTMAADVTSQPAPESPQPSAQRRTAKFRYCLNTSTIRGQELSITEEIDIAGQAGYDGIEPWIRKIREHVDGGGTLSDLRKRIDDHGLQVESAIGFAKWIVDDKGERKAGLDELKSDMDLIAQLGGTHIAAPPAGASGQDAPKLDLFVVAERYRAALEVGDETGVVPQVEIWGPSKNLSRLGEAVFVAVESGHSSACVLPDVYHIFRGGSDFAGLKVLSGAAVHAFHFNDYPAGERTTLNDSDRVYPGNGVAPFEEIIEALHASGYHCALSLELFNKSYWEQDALEVATTGLKKLKAVTEL